MRPVQVPGASELESDPLGIEASQDKGEFPYWLVLMLLIIGFFAYLTFFDPSYRGARRAILPGLVITIRATLIAFVIALVIGLIASLGRIARNSVIRTLATTYIEFIRGVPMLVLIFVVALVIVPLLAESLGLTNRLPQEARAITALALIYGGYIAEVFRAGVESVPPGQMEASRSLGMPHSSSMRHVILPQAVRNVLPALGNDFISMLKDSSLLSVLGVTEITQEARLFANSTFQFREGFLVLTFLYLTMTLVLSLLVAWLGRRLRRG
ncbi:MAG: amino acid ABC transporter permease [Acidimicrobiia bacterium]